MAPQDLAPGVARQGLEARIPLHDVPVGIDAEDSHVRAVKDPLRSRRRPVRQGAEIGGGDRLARRLARRELLRDKQHAGDLPKQIVVTRRAQCQGDAPSVREHHRHVHHVDRVALQCTPKHPRHHGLCLGVDERHQHLPDNLVRLNTSELYELDVPLDHHAGHVRAQHREQPGGHAHLIRKQTLHPAVGG